MTPVGIGRIVDMNGSTRVCLDPQPRQRQLRRAGQTNTQQHVADRRPPGWLPVHGARRRHAHLPVRAAGRRHERRAVRPTVGTDSRRDLLAGRRNPSAPARPALCKTGHRPRRRAGRIVCSIWARFIATLAPRRNSRYTAARCGAQHTGEWRNVTQGAKARGVVGQRVHLLAERAGPATPLVVS